MLHSDVDSQSFSVVERHKRKHHSPRRIEQDEGLQSSERRKQNKTKYKNTKMYQGNIKLKKNAIEISKKIGFKTRKKKLGREKGFEEKCKESCF